jgi:hypothetical protein
MPVGFSGVASYANTYPGTALGVVANANNGWGNAVGGSTVIVGNQTSPTAYYIDLETLSGPGVILMETTGKILLEIS